MFQVLFVCSGNTCRSPMAQALLQEKLRLLGLDKFVTAGSAGVAAWPGQPASPEAIAVMNREGISLADHRSGQIDVAQLSVAALVLAMTRSHRESLLRLFPDLGEKIFTLGDFSGNGLDIADPYGCHLEDYQSCANQISQMLDSVLDKILRQAGKTG